MATKDYRLRAWRSLADSLQVVDFCSFKGPTGDAAGLTSVEAVRTEKYNTSRVVSYDLRDANGMGWEAQRELQTSAAFRYCGIFYDKDSGDMVLVPVTQSLSLHRRVEDDGPLPSDAPSKAGYAEHKSDVMDFLEENELDAISSATNAPDLFKLRERRDMRKQRRTAEDEEDGADVDDRFSDDDSDAKDEPAESDSDDEGGKSASAVDSAAEPSETASTAASKKRPRTPDSDAGPDKATAKPPAPKKQKAASGSIVPPSPSKDAPLSVVSQFILDAFAAQPQTNIRDLWKSIKGHLPETISKEDAQSAFKEATRQMLDTVGSQVTLRAGAKRL